MAWIRSISRGTSQSLLGLEPEFCARSSQGACSRRNRLLQRRLQSGGCCPALEEKGVTLALENNEAFSAVEFAGIISRIASPYVGICLDTANSLGRSETFQTVVEKLAEHAVVLHAKDYDIRRIDTRMGFSVVGTPAGDGRVDFDWVLAELNRRGRSGISVIVEHWPPFAGTIEQSIRIEQEWFSRSVQFLRSKLSAVGEGQTN